MQIFAILGQKILKNLSKILKLTTLLIVDLLRYAKKLKQCLENELHNY
jgi:hypothetical protein